MIRIIYYIFIFLQTFVSGNILFNNKKIESVTVNENNLINLNGPIDSYLISNLIHKSNLEPDDIYIYISSPGGSVVSGNYFIDFMESLEQKGKKIICIGDVAISMAFVIFQACPNRYILKSSILMQHQMSLGIQGQFENIKTRLDMISNIDKQINEMQAKKIGLSLSEFKKKTLSDWWLYGTSIIENKVADKIVNVLCDDSLLGGKTNEVLIDSIWGSIKIIYSKCPLSREPLKIQMMDNKSMNNKKKINSLYNINEFINNYNKDDFQNL